MHESKSTWELTTCDVVGVDSQPNKVFVVGMASVSPNTLPKFSVPQLELTVGGTGRGHGNETGPEGEWE